MLTEKIAEFSKPSGEKTLGVKCSGCKKVEMATLIETKKIFRISLKYAGWKYRKNKEWLCPNCD